MSKETESKEGEAAKADSPLETLTSLVLDAADAANDSAQSTQEAISRLSHVVDTNLDTTRALRTAPAIFGAVILSIGIAIAVVVAMVFSKLDERAAALNQAIVAQEESLEKMDKTLKSLSNLESDLQKFQRIADDTTQRAVVTLREQVKADRLAVQELEVRRLNEILASFRGAVAGAPPPGSARQNEENKRFAALEKSLTGLEGAISRVDARLAAMEQQSEKRMSAIEKSMGARSSSEAGGKRPVAVLSDAQAKDMKATAAEVGRLKQEIASLRELIERRGSELQSGVPTIKK
jgi:DNA repair exonuclease SbcCD ATPase subunit